MRGLILLAVGARALAGCASAPPPSSWRTVSPQPVEHVPATYGNGGLCSYAQEHEIDAYAPTVAELKPSAVSLCIPVFPIGLQRRGYEAECMVRFHLTAGGKAVSPAAECDVWSDAAQTPEWDAFARATFTKLAEMSVEQSVYSTKPEGRASKTYGRRISFRSQ